MTSRDRNRGSTLLALFRLPHPRLIVPAQTTAFDLYICVVQFSELDRAMMALSPTPDRGSAPLSNTSVAGKISVLHNSAVSETHDQEDDLKDAGEQKLRGPAPSSSEHAEDGSTKVSTRSPALETLGHTRFTRDTARTCVAFAIVFMVGFHAGATGLNLSLIREHYKLTYEQVSTIFAPMIIGQVFLALVDDSCHAETPGSCTDSPPPLGRDRSRFLLACGACPYLIQHVGLQWALVVSCTTWCVACVVLVVQPPFHVLVVALATLAAAAGSYEALLTTVISHNKNPVIMSWLYANFAVGAACAPVVVGNFVAHDIGWSKFYIVLLSLSLALAVFARLVFLGYVSPSESSVEDEADPTMAHTSRRTDMEAQGRSEAEGKVGATSNLKTVDGNPKAYHHPASTTARLRRSLGLKIVWLGLALLCLAYATTDLLAAWTSSYLMMVKHASKPASKYLLSGYWAGVACGRIVLPLALYKRLGERLFAEFLLLVGALMLTLIWVIKSYQLDAVALAFCGFVIGPMSPHGLSTISSRVPASLRPSVVAFTLACAVTSGGLTPLFFGFVAGKEWLSCLPGCLIVMCALAAGVWLLVPKKQDEN